MERKIKIKWSLVFLIFLFFFITPEVKREEKAADQEFHWTIFLPLLLIMSKPADIGGSRWVGAEVQIVYPSSKESGKIVEYDRDNDIYKVILTVFFLFKTIINDWGEIFLKIY